MTTSDNPTTRFLEWLRHEEEALSVDFERGQVRWLPRHAQRATTVRIAPRTLHAMLPELCERGEERFPRRDVPKNPELAAWELLLHELRAAAREHPEGAPLHLDRDGAFAPRASAVRAAAARSRAAQASRARRQSSPLSSLVHAS